jgi:hypothetical protein
MSSNRSPRIRRNAAEQMLDGAPATTEATRPLAALLHAAAAPAHPEELSGERAALAAFEDAAALDSVPGPRRGNVLKSTLAKILTVKAAVILAAAAGTTGVVLAATSGASNPTDRPSDNRPADPPAVHSSKHAPADKPRNGGESGKSGDAPSPSMAGLCNAYEAHKSDNPGKALDSPAFTALIEAAGGRHNVDDYCDALDASKDNGRSDDTHGKPTDDPNNHGNGNGANGNGANGNQGNGGPPAEHPAAPSRDHAPDNTPPTGPAESP